METNINFIKLFCDENNILSSSKVSFLKRVTMNMIKPVTPFDKMFIDIDCKIGLTLKKKKEKEVPRIIEKIKKMCLPTRMKIENDHFTYIGHDMPIANIPDNINNLETACQWLYDNCSPVPHNSLGMIAANRNIIGLNVTHSCCDGTFIINLINAISNDIDFPENNSLQNAPESFEKEIAAATEYPEDCMIHPGLSRITPKDPHFTSQNGYLQYVKAVTPAKDLKCYDPKTGKPTRFTDAMYANICLTFAAYEGKLDKIGLLTDVNMRQFTKGEHGLEMGNSFAMIDIEARNVTVDTTVREIMKKTRSFYNERIKDGSIFGSFKHFHDEIDQTKIIPKAPALLSNIGIFNLRGPIEDMFLRDTTITKPDDFPRADFVHYAIKNGKRNDCCTILEFNQNKFSPREAQMIVNSVHYGLRNIDLDTSAGNAIEKLQKFQENFIKNEYPKYERKY